MTTKKIILSDGTIVYMTYEQVVEQFEKLIDKATYQTVSVCSVNKLEFDDVKQEMLVSTWKAFNKYDESSGYAFITYLFYWLKNAKSKIISLETRQKRNGMREFSMNAAVKPGEEGEVDFINFLCFDDESYGDFELNYNYNIIKSELNDKENVMFDVLIINESMSGADLAKKWGVSRQAVNKSLISLKKKIQKIMLEKDLLSDTKWENFFNESY